MWTIGEMIRHERKARGMSLDDLAVLTGHSKSGIWEIEAGRNDPRVSTVKNIARQMGVSVGYLMGDANGPELSKKERAMLTAVRRIYGSAP